MRAMRSVVTWHLHGALPHTGSSTRTGRHKRTTRIGAWKGERISSRWSCQHPLVIAARSSSTTENGTTSRSRSACADQAADSADQAADQAADLAADSADPAAYSAADLAADSAADQAADQAADSAADP